MNLILLDVDGVVNAVPVWGPHEPRECPWPCGWEVFQADFHGGSYDITYAPDLTKALLDIHTSGLAEVRWLTTWGKAANEALPAFGFPKFTVVGEPPRVDLTEPGWWKLPLAKVAAAACEGKVVWADDDLIHDTEAFTWADETENVLPLIPHPYSGLTPADIERAREFLS